MKNGADNFTAERDAELRKNIDFSDIPEIKDFSDCPKQTKEELAQFQPWYEVHQDWYKPTKTEIHIRIDTDVLEWYKSQGKGYQTKMNAVLRAHAFG